MWFISNILYDLQSYLKRWEHYTDKQTIRTIAYNTKLGLNLFDLDREGRSECPNITYE